MKNKVAIESVIEEVTGGREYSFAAHLDPRQHRVYWGSDFICYVRQETTADEVRSKLEEYIATRMRVR